MDSLRQTAATRLYEITQKAPRAEQASQLREAFESLELSGDPVGQALARGIAELEGWAGDNQERLADLYATGLKLAACAVGGAAAAGLAEVSDWRALSHLGDLACEAGRAGRPLLEALVPRTWQDGSGLDTPDAELLSERWRLGQQLTLLQADRPDLLPELGYLREYRLGEPIGVADAERNVRQRVIFSQRYREQGWEDRTGQHPAELENRYVAILAPVDGELREYRGEVRCTPGKSTFGLAGIPDVSFSGNTVAVLMTRG